MNRYTGRANTGNKARRGDRLKADDLQNMQRSIADMQSMPGSGLPQVIELVRVPSDIANDASVDCYLQSFDVATTAFSDIGAHALRKVYNPYPDTITTGIIPVVRIGGAVVPVRGGGGGGGTGLAKTPSGGIPARSTITAGVATCTVAELYDDAGTIKIREKSPTESVEIYNTTGVTISGNAWIHWKTDGAYKVIDVDDCSGGSGGLSLNGGTP